MKPGMESVKRRARRAAPDFHPLLLEHVSPVPAPLSPNHLRAPPTPVSALLEPVTKSVKLEHETSTPQPNELKPVDAVRLRVHENPHPEPDSHGQRAQEGSQGSDLRACRRNRGPLQKFLAFGLGPHVVRVRVVGNRPRKRDIIIAWDGASGPARNNI